MLQTHEMLTNASSDDDKDKAQVALGLGIRKLKQHWRLGQWEIKAVSISCFVMVRTDPPIFPHCLNAAGVVLSAILILPFAAPLDVEPPPAMDSATEAASNVGLQQQQRLLERCQLLMSSAAVLGLEDCWQWKPILDGKQV